MKHSKTVKKKKASNNDCPKELKKQPKTAIISFKNLNISPKQL